MRKIYWVSGLILLAALSALAQSPAGSRGGLSRGDVPSAELSLGYSFLRASDGGSVNFHGGSASIAGNLNRWFGIVGDFGGYRPSESGISASVFSYVFGPPISYRDNERITPFAQVLVGGARISAIGASLNSFAAVAGGGIDIKADEHIAIRLVQAEYVFTHFAGVKQNNVRLSAGVVFRFGRK